MLAYCAQSHRLLYLEQTKLLLYSSYYFILDFFFGCSHFFFGCLYEFDFHFFLSGGKPSFHFFLAFFHLFLTCFYLQYMSCIICCYWVAMSVDWAHLYWHMLKYFPQSLDFTPCTRTTSALSVTIKHSRNPQFHFRHCCYVYSVEKWGISHLTSFIYVLVSTYIAL